MAWPLFPTPKSISGKEDSSQLDKCGVDSVESTGEGECALAHDYSEVPERSARRMNVGINKLRPRQGTTGVEQGCFLAGLRLSDSETH
ncbi:unnamed protein product [Clonostachys rosea f. rosea IK726]|uniref:Uncharacterized protein n=2 Tax=Bionectria ochroleuca TaxID=29856 RepID=A0A0B7KMR3_BIOOC|nr:unnamed protein product [Clonostachys rosea f. rosea IK726]